MLSRQFLLLRFSGRIKDRAFSLSGHSDSMPAVRSKTVRSRVVLILLDRFFKSQR